MQQLNNLLDPNFFRFRFWARLSRFVEKFDKDTTPATKDEPVPVYRKDGSPFVGKLITELSSHVGGIISGWFDNQIT